MALDFGKPVASSEPTPQYQPRCSIRPEVLTWNLSERERCTVLRFLHNLPFHRPVFVGFCFKRIEPESKVSRRFNTFFWFEIQAESAAFDTSCSAGAGWWDFPGEVRAVGISVSATDTSHFLFIYLLQVLDGNCTTSAENKRVTEQKSSAICWGRVHPGLLCLVPRESQLTKPGSPAEVARHGFQAPFWASVLCL